MTSYRSRPYGLVAEFTYRCPLRCPYCSNPLALNNFPETLDTESWCRVLAQAAELGVVHVGLSGGEPTLRRDLDTIVREASHHELYTHLITSGMPIDANGLARLVDEGLCSVQLSVQDSEEERSDRIAGTKSFARKLEFAGLVRKHDLPLTLNVVLHRQNLKRVPAIIDLAVELGAYRLELANTQYHGWALRNRAALLPTQEQLLQAAKVVRDSRPRHPNLEILFVLPDYYAERPKPCMGGWGQTTLVVTPDGRVLPCQAAGELPGLEFWSVKERSLADCWNSAPGMNAFRGEDWMRDPCRSCPERKRDYGGCRCQAFSLTGDASATDPACALSPDHHILEAARDEAIAPAADLIYREPARRSKATNPSRT